MTNETHQIVRYSNRKLYSKRMSRYLKLGEVLKLSLSENVSVHNNKDGVNITNQVLIQAIANAALLNGTAQEKFLSLTKELVTDLV